MNTESELQFLNLRLVDTLTGADILSPAWMEPLKAPTESVDPTTAMPGQRFILAVDNGSQFYAVGDRCESIHIRAEFVFDSMLSSLVRVGGSLPTEHMLHAVIGRALPDGVVVKSIEVMGHESNAEICIA